MSVPAASTPSAPRRSRPAFALVLAAAISLLLPVQLLAAEASPAPDLVASPAPTMTPAEAVCERLSDLRLIIEFLRDVDVAEDGWLPAFVGAIAALSEARQLASAVGDTYRPLVADLIGSLEGLRSTIDALGEMGTTGARIAVIGEAITDIGNAMDALSVQLQAPCPTAAPAEEDAP